MGRSSEHHFFRFRGTVVEAERCHGGGGPGLDLYTLLGLSEGFPGRSADKESSCNAGYLGSAPGLGGSPGGGNGNPHQYSCLDSPMDRGVWRAAATGSRSRTRQRLSPARHRLEGGGWFSVWVAGWVPPPEDEMSLIWCTLGIGSLNASQGILICSQGWPTWLGHEEGRGSRKVGNREPRCRGTHAVEGSDQPSWPQTGSC